MATYHSNSSDQQEISINLYQRDPASIQYPETPANMMMYMNYPTSSGPYADTMAGNSQPQQTCVDGQLEFTPSQQGMLSSLSDQSYNVWRGDGRNEMVFMHPTGVPMTMQFSDDLVRNPVTDDPQMSIRAQMGLLQAGHNLQGQGLSLSLSTQISSAIPIPPSFNFRQPNPSGMSSFVGSHSHPTISGEGGSGDESSHGKQLRDVDYFQHNFYGSNQGPIKRETVNNIIPGTSPREVSGLASSIRNSKYLKVTQELLDEVVNVRKALKQRDPKNQVKGGKDTNGTSKDGTSVSVVDSQGMTSNSANDLSPTERQDLQNKVSKLLAMLDEVDRRYRQYYHQMQIVVSSFDVIAGSGSAKLYTALPLETISRHFRGLRDAISGQIKATRRSLGENTTENTKEGGMSRLRFVDQQLKQQKALQQLGMMQQHAWRPQRGLPENSVTILRAWLFEHFLHPYPKDSDKTMLARQTGLTRSQVSNWFINARVRLWKPMVEEMYKEEFGDNEIDSNSTSDTNAPKLGKDDTKVPQELRDELQQRSNPSSQFHEAKSDFIAEEDMCGPTAGDNFQNMVHGESSTDYGVMKFRGNQRIHMDGPSSLLQDTFQNPITFPMAELERFGPRAGGGGVSLTLGLQHSEGGSGMPMSGGTHRNFIIRGDEMYGAASSLGPDDTTEYDCLEGDNRRQRFSSSNILHDFVA